MLFSAKLYMICRTDGHSLLLVAAFLTCYKISIKASLSCWSNITFHSLEMPHLIMQKFEIDLIFEDLNFIIFCTVFFADHNLGLCEKSHLNLFVLFPKSVASFSLVTDKFLSIVHFSDTLGFWVWTFGTWDARLIFEGIRFLCYQCYLKFVLIFLPIHILYLHLLHDATKLS